MRDYRSNIIVALNKKLGDCLILVAECEAVCQVILMTIQRNIPKIIIQNDSQVVVNAINSKKELGYYKPRRVLNVFLTQFSKSRLEHCNKIINRDAAAVAKMAHM